MTTTKDIIENVLRERILFIGEEPPNIKRDCLQIYSGCPNDLVNELMVALRYHKSILTVSEARAVVHDILDNYRSIGVANIERATDRGTTLLLGAFVREKATSTADSGQGPERA